MSSTFPIIETLLQEFYLTTTPNARKREIEAQLLAYKSQPDVWRLCLPAATNLDTNQYMWFYCTSTLDHTITRRWDQLVPGDRMVLRDTLWHAYANMSPLVAPRRQRDTLAQLIALIGKREFPDDDPNYINRCVELIKNNFPMGINLLRMTSEELTNTRKDLTSDRKNYFHSCISICFPDVVNLVTKYLLIGVCHINGESVTSLSSNLIDYGLLSTLPNDNQLECSLLELLACTQHLVTWIQTDLLSNYFLLSILDLSLWRKGHHEISLAALSVLNELLYLQKPLPHMMTLMNGVNGLLEQHNNLKDQNEMYTDKFREFLRLYTVKYWPKLINETELMEKFLKSLYCCTILKNGAMDFTEKLEIWTAIVKALILHSKLMRYNDIMHQLVGEIMHRIQFINNKGELELLDNEIVEDNVQTEWQQFLTQCIEFIALLAESRPNAIFAQVLSYWSRPHVYLMSIQNDIENSKMNEIMLKLKCHTFTENLRDYATICQAVVRIVPLLDTTALDTRSEVATQIQLLTEYLFTTLHFFRNNQIGLLNIDKSAFQSDLDYLYAQILMALCSIFPLSDSSKSTELLHNIFNVINKIFLDYSTPIATIVYMAASQLLLCISSVIRPKYFLEDPAIVSLMWSGSKLSHLPKQVVANIYISLISFLVLPWKNTDDREQDYSQRSIILREYIERIGKSFLEKDLDTDTKSMSSIIETLEIFTMVIEFFKDVNNHIKELLTSTFKPIVMKALTLYNTLGITENALATSVADLSLSILRTLYNQFGSQFVKEMITLFISVNSRVQFTLNQVVVMEKILQMFQVIVEQPGSTSMSLLPSILEFTFEQILPPLQQKNNVTDNSDLSSLLCNLYNSVLIFKWQYFYKPNVQHNGSLHQASNENQHPQHFMTIMNTFGQILVTCNDPNVVRIVLSSMQNVNDRWRLYQRPLFKENLSSSFQSAIITMLLSSEGALHYDLLVNALFAMGQADNIKLRESFINAGFPIQLKVLDEICVTNDIPTFSQKLMQLIQDTQCISV